MDAQARLKPIAPFERLAGVLATCEPLDRPRYYRLLCGGVRETAQGRQLCPQSFGEVLPAGVRQGRVSRATKLRALSVLPPVKPSDWLLDLDGYCDRAEDGAYVVIRRRPRRVQPGWRHTGNEFYPAGRRRLPEEVRRAAGRSDLERMPGLAYLTVVPTGPTTRLIEACRHVQILSG